MEPNGSKKEKLKGTYFGACDDFTASSVSSITFGSSSLSKLSNVQKLAYMQNMNHAQELAIVKYIKIALP